MLLTTDKTRKKLPTSDKKIIKLRFTDNRQSNEILAICISRVFEETPDGKSPESSVVPHPQPNHQAAEGWWGGGEGGGT